MRILLLYNPIAGRGRGRVSARRLSAVLADNAHDVAVHETRLAPTDDWLDPLLADREVLVVVGGDGAVRMASPAAARAGTPIYQYPHGTENLFAREFGMTRSPARLVEAIGKGRIERVDMARADGQRFLLMASVGFDAEVIHDLARRRAGRISHLSYIVPMVRQLASWSPPRLSIEVDGVPVVDGEAGFVVVANSRQYARRFDPASRAVMTDGRLDVAFFPTANRRSLVGWAWRCARGTQVDDPRLVYRTGCEIVIGCDPPRRFQLDGDPPAPGGTGETCRRLDIAVDPGVLPVLIP